MARSGWSVACNSRRLDLRTKEILCMWSQNLLGTNRLEQISMTRRPVVVLLVALHLLFFLWLCAAVVGNRVLPPAPVYQEVPIHSCLLSLDSIKRKYLYRSTTWNKDLNLCHNPIQLRSSSFPIFADIFAWQDVLASLVLFSSVYQKCFSKRFVFFFLSLWGSKSPILFPAGFFMWRDTSSIWNTFFLLHQSFSRHNHSVTLSPASLCNKLVQMYFNRVFVFLSQICKT